MVFPKVKSEVPYYTESKIDVEFTDVPTQVSENGNAPRVKAENRGFLMDQIKKQGHFLGVETRSTNCCKNLQETVRKWGGEHNFQRRLRRFISTSPKCA